MVLPHEQVTLLLQINGQTIIGVGPNDFEARNKMEAAGFPQMKNLLPVHHARVNGRCTPTFCLGMKLKVKKSFCPSEIKAHGSCSLVGVSKL